MKTAIVATRFTLTEQACDSPVDSCLMWRAASTQRTNHENCLPVGGGRCSNVQTRRGCWHIHLCCDRTAGT
jgi:hypothetical protein